MHFQFFILALLLPVIVFGTQPDQKNLPIDLAPFEKDIVERDVPQTPPPTGPVVSLAEWESSKGVMVLWNNPSLIKALLDNGPVYLLADSNSEKSWWKNWLSVNNITEDHVRYFIVPTDSIWIRDYGPWFILDGNRDFGLIDTKYNRPRPLDDVVPLYLSKELKIPYFQPGLVHTGGNYYNDALGNAFSSTLVFSENNSLSKEQVFDRMLRYLGIERYVTSRLSPGSTIQHLDTFGKLVTPDTWVFSDFPSGSQHKTDSDNMVNLIRTLTSPYGTPYKIYRMKMIPFESGGFRAYLNSFISNGVLYYPRYGDSIDLEARDVFQSALPGYKIVGVDAMGTSWGDSVHCRTRNLLTREAIFLFPHISKQNSRSGVSLKVDLEAVPSPAAKFENPPQLNYSVNGVQRSGLAFSWIEKNNWKAEIVGLNPKDKLSLWISAQDTNGVIRSEPRFAPIQTIEFEIEHERF